MHLNSRKIFQICFIPFVLIGILSYCLSTYAISQSAHIEAIYRLLAKGFVFAASFSLCTWIILNKENKRFILQIFHKK